MFAPLKGQLFNPAGMSLTLQRGDALNGKRVSMATDVVFLRRCYANELETFVCGIHLNAYLENITKK